MKLCKWLLDGILAGLIAGVLVTFSIPFVEENIFDIYSKTVGGYLEPGGHDNYVFKANKNNLISLHLEQTPSRNTYTFKIFKKSDIKDLNSFAIEKDTAVECKNDTRSYMIVCSSGLGGGKAIHSFMPSETTEYILRILDRDGKALQYTVTIDSNITVQKLN